MYLGHRDHSSDWDRRNSGPSDSLAPPPSPYPAQIEPSPVDSNGTETTEIDEDAQEDKELKSPDQSSENELKSPDIEISSPQSASSVCEIALSDTIRADA